MSTSRNGQLVVMASVGVVLTRIFYLIFYHLFIFLSLSFILAKEMSSAQARANEYKEFDKEYTDVSKRLKGEVSFETVVFSFWVMQLTTINQSTSTSLLLFVFLLLVDLSVPPKRGEASRQGRGGAV